MDKDSPERIEHDKGTNWLADSLGRRQLVYCPANPFSWSRRLLKIREKGKSGYTGTASTRMRLLAGARLNLKSAVFLGFEPNLVVTALGYIPLAL
jgi:hypothetical protein